jgi:SNF2 family DNA or RNA helicase
VRVLLTINGTMTLSLISSYSCPVFALALLHKITSPKDYDMVIIDEAHKFRNDTAQAYDELQRICKTKNNEDEDFLVLEFLCILF